MSDGGRLTNSLSPFIKTGIHVDLPNTLVKKTNKTNFWREWDMVGVKQVDFGGNWFVLGLLVKGGGGRGRERWKSRGWQSVTADMLAMRRADNQR